MKFLIEEVQHKKLMDFQRKSKTYSLKSLKLKDKQLPEFGVQSEPKYCLQITEITNAVPFIPCICFNVSLFQRDKIEWVSMQAPIQVSVQAMCEKIALTLILCLERSNQVRSKVDRSNLERSKCVLLFRLKYLDRDK